MASGNTLAPTGIAGSTVLRHPIGRASCPMSVRWRGLSDPAELVSDYRDGRGAAAAGPSSYSRRRLRSEHCIHEQVRRVRSSRPLCANADAARAAPQPAAQNTPGECPNCRVLQRAPSCLRFRRLSRVAAGFGPCVSRRDTTATTRGTGGRRAIALEASCGYIPDGLRGRGVARRLVSGRWWRSSLRVRRRGGCDR